MLLGAYAQNSIPYTQMVFHTCIIRSSRCTQFFQRKLRVQQLRLTQHPPMWGDERTGDYMPILLDPQLCKSPLKKSLFLNLLHVTL